MALSGLHIPVSENSSIYVFDNIFVDIGDNQSISESLSTFSSHMINIINILKQATSESLVLLDELGSGTDPKEGSNLAISILDKFYSTNCLTIFSTHYTDIKNFVQVTDGFENASFEFCTESLAPTYKLIIGIPGKSNAFEISKKLGLDKEILNKAYSLMETSAVNIEDLLKSIHITKQEIDYKESETSKNLNQIEVLRKKLEKDYSTNEYKAQKIVDDAKKEAREIIEEAKNKVSFTLKELNTHKNSSSIRDLNNLRNTLNENIKNLSVSGSNSVNVMPILKENIEVGMSVFVLPLNQNGVVLSLPNSSSEIQIQIGNMKMNMHTSQLSASKLQSTKKKNMVSNYQNHSYSQKAITISPEINVIGLNVDEAAGILDKYLDDAAISKLELVRIVHGKGTGKLRLGIHSFLKSHPHVKSYRLGTFGEGEMGVTVVELK